MLAFYPQIKLVHIAAVSASGAFFALRALGLLAGMRWPRMAPVRYLSYTIDTALLTAALMLLTALKLNPFVVPWLSVKLALLVVYVVLGSLALKRGRSARMRGGCYVAAVLVYLVMIGIARAHHPLGWIHYWLA